MATRPVLAALVLCLIGAAPPAFAQDRRVWVDAGAGFTAPGPGVRSSFGSGWNAGMGFSFDLGDAVAVRLDFLHVRLGDRSAQVEGTAPGHPATISASHFMESGTAAIRIATPARGRRARAYAVAGGGIYYRKVTLTSQDAGSGGVCNPWWLVCIPGPGPTDRVLGRRNSVDPGINVGGGVEIAAGDRASFFIEARYHYIFGPMFTDSQGAARKASGHYLPVTVGFRF